MCLINRTDANSSPHKDAYNCSIAFSTSTSNFTCCESIKIHKSELTELSIKKTTEFEQQNAQKFNEAKNVRALRSCIYNVYLSQAYYFDGKFHRDKFYDFMMNKTDYVDYKDNIIGIFEKCVTFVVGLKIKEIQEQELNVKQEDCNLEPQLVSRCMINQFKAVSENAINKTVYFQCDSSLFYTTGLCH